MLWIGSTGLVDSESLESIEYRESHVQQRALSRIRVENGSISPGRILEAFVHAKKQIVEQSRMAKPGAESPNTVRVIIARTSGITHLGGFLKDALMIAANQDPCRLVK